MPPTCSASKGELRLDCETDTVPAPIRLQQRWCPLKEQYWWFLLKGDHIVKTGPTVRLLTEVTRDYEINLESLAPKVPGLGTSGDIDWVDDMPWEKADFVSKKLSVVTTENAVKVWSLTLARL